MWQNLSQLVQRLPTSSAENQSLPGGYYRPITFNLIHDPEINAEGNTFEGAAIDNWIWANGNSPITCTSLSVKDMYPNHAISKLLHVGRRKGMH
jgi:hypothetical protein